jgi:hypothetical protein
VSFLVRVLFDKFFNFSANVFGDFATCLGFNTEGFCPPFLPFV